VRFSSHSKSHPAGSGYMHCRRRQPISLNEEHLLSEIKLDSRPIL
jgi:hypothetical protein